MTVNPLVAGSGAVILDSQFQVTLTAIGQPLVSSTNDSGLLAGPQTALYVPIYADFASQPGTIIGFVYYNNWSYTSGSLALGPACRRHADWPVRTSRRRWPCPCRRRLLRRMSPRCFRTMRPYLAQYPLYAPALVNR